MSCCSSDDDTQAAAAEDVRDPRYHWHSYWEFLVGHYITYRDRPYLGERLLKEDGTYGPFRYLSYGAIYRRVEQLGTALAIHPDLGLAPQSFVGILMENRREWVVADHACCRQNIVSVPLHTAADGETLAYIINHCELETVIVSENTLVENLVPILADCPRISRIIVAFNAAPGATEGSPMDSDDDGGADGGSADGPGCLGSQHQIMLVSNDEAGPPTAPKQPMTMAEATALVAGGCAARDSGVAVPDAQVFDMAALNAWGRDNLAPPAGTPQREDILTILYTSGTTGAPKGAILSNARWCAFTKDYYQPYGEGMRVISFAPMAHIAERQGQCITLAFGGAVGFFHGDMGAIFDDMQTLNPTLVVAVPRFWNHIYAEWKAELARRTEEEPDEDEATLRTESIQPFRGILGNSLQYLVSGSAKCNPIVKAWLEECYRVTVYDGYGTTETGAISSDGVMESTIEWRLVDVPELGYLATDTPFPRGEIWVKTPTMMSGYYKNAEATAGAISEDGWFATGDIGEQVEEGKVVIIDRKKNVIKMPNGEFLAPEAVEGVLLTSPLVDQLCVVGDSMVNYVLAVVVPNCVVLRPLVNGADGTTDAELCAMEEAVNLVRAEVAKLGMEADTVPSYGIPRDVVLSPEPFSAENGLRTPTNKLNRVKVKKAFASRLNVLFEMPSAADVLADLGFGDGAGVESAGMDSLSKVRLVNTVRDKFNKEIPLEFLQTNPTAEQIAAYIDADESGPSRGGLAAEAGADVDALALEWETDVTAGLVAPEAIKSIFLTGATGFLGAYLVLELLTAFPGAVLRCLVRGDDPAGRLARVMADVHGAEAVDAWGDRLVAMGGRLDADRFGMDEAAYNTLASEAEMVVHNGAVVNWLTSYAELRQPNVVATQRAINLCGHGRSKVLIYVSTISVGRGDEPEALHLTPEVAYKTSPYNASKWVAEGYVRAAVEAGLTAVIARPGMVTGHWETGRSNVDDFVNRLIRGCASAGYFCDEDIYVDMTPVDFVARAIAALARVYNAGPASAIHHITNLNGSPTYALVGAGAAAAGFDVTPLRYVPFRNRLIADEREWRAAGSGAGESSASRSSAATVAAGNPLFGVLPFLGPRLWRGIPRYATANTEAHLAVAAEVAGLDTACPTIDADYIARCLDYHRENGSL